MRKLKNYDEFINESFTISLKQLPSIGDIVDKVDWREGEKIAFIDFKGVKNIPVKIVNDTIVEDDTNKVEDAVI
jgi:hypothetical protein